MVKKRLVLLFAIFCVMISAVRADVINPLVYQYENPDVTVEFSEPLYTSIERQKEIADKLAGVTPTSLTGPNASSPENIICTLFGHDLAPTATVTVTHHKVNKYNPRCLMELYHVTYCQRCNYTVETLESSFFILCCPED